MAGTRGTLNFITPRWAAPARVRAVASTRSGGISRGPYAGLNLGDHVGDEPAAVARNRELLRLALELDRAPLWLQQVHGARVVTAESGGRRTRADAIVASTAGPVCAVLTADCLPVLFCDRTGQYAAAAHAGWRGMAAGILEATVAALDQAGAGPASLLAWLGPAIGPEAYEVGNDVRTEFLASDPGSAEVFHPTRPGHWRLDLYTAARRRLRSAGVTAITGGEHCTHGEPERFFSHRRDGTTGRQATLIWLVD